MKFQISPLDVVSIFFPPYVIVVIYVLIKFCNHKRLPLSSWLPKDWLQFSNTYMFRWVHSSLRIVLTVVNFFVGTLVLEVE